MKSLHAIWYDQSASIYTGCAIVLQKPHDALKNSVQIRAGSSKFQVYKLTILHADILEIDAFMQVTITPYENMLSSPSINVVNLISAMHVTKQ